VDSEDKAPHEHDEPQEGARGQREISRKQFLVGGAAVGATVGLGGAAFGFAKPSRAAPTAPAVQVGARAKKPQGIDIALLNGKIHTMDGSNRVVSEVLIENGRFVQVGNPKDKAEKDKRDKKLKDAINIDLKGRTVVPGVVESHIHVVSMANRPGYHTPTENATSIAEVIETLAARRPDVPAGQWITSMGGWHPNMWIENRPVPPSTSPPNPLKYPTLQQLDAAIPDRPVFMYLGFTGPAVVNSLGKQYLENPPAPPAPQPFPGAVAVGADGLITSGTQAQRGLYYLRMIQTWEDRLRSTRDAMAYAASTGLTSMLDQVLFPIPGPPQPSWVLSNLDGFRMYDPWLELDRREETIVRLQMNFLHNQSDPALPELHERLKNQFQFFGNDMTMTGAIGEWAAPLGAGPVWMEAQRLVAQYRWRNENAVGNSAQLQQCVDAYEAVDGEFGIKDLRWVVHHVPVATTQQLDDLKALGVGIVMKAFSWITGTPTSAINGAPFRMMVDHGIKAGIEGDGVHISTLNPWHHMHYATTGLNAGGLQINPGQSITRQEALRAFTTENAWFLRREHELGSIEVGKLADLAVLNKDYFTVPDADLKKTRSVLTVVNGQVVHDSGVV
jgi:predicted amidohydrolase YtcJ